MQEIAKASGASPRTPLGELTALPQTPYLMRVGDTPFRTVPLGASRRGTRRFAPREWRYSIGPGSVAMYLNTLRASVFTWYLNTFSKYLVIEQM